MGVFRPIEHRKNGFESAVESNRGVCGEKENKFIQECSDEDEQIKQENTKKRGAEDYQYEDEDGSEEEEADNSAIDFTHASNVNQGIPQLPLTFPSTAPHLNPFIDELRLSPTRKQQINFILNHLASQYRNVSNHQA